MTVKACVTPGCAKTGIWACAGSQLWSYNSIPLLPDQSNAAYIEPFHLNSYRNWGLEMKELKERLGWPQADEAGKLYPEKNIDTWYYYMYQSAGFNLPKNKLASQCLGRTVKGDVAVVRSSPDDVDGYDESFSKMDLVRTIDYYKTANSRQVFQQREHSRLPRKMGMPGDF
ncbi:hypothetical protein DTO006G1_8223 [Penicillium roqueforti]|nr:uncharacterized protein LCP9604111_8819 [Penicillium roqueforti]KAF9240341.1 hypothetical protein LCP9604111_8819 [Penicillium roqueforti]KAI1835286.1 hypothetical protein CBS147337_4103 [Penicillium roqueforti]KAI2719983.1 hypothetical protein CBS147318_3289 [Penicillium roqueforti]KAI2737798.1 hypothetical protein DTO013F2_9730 [Penicillium roqueforti]KAI2755705.1 hypothetical protein DTO006G1_8223 [Penicillium roqueforti]